MRRPYAPLIKAGGTVRLEEPDCKYGAGPLLLRVTAIGDTRRESDGAQLNCVTATPRDGETGHSERYALPRITAICLNPSLQEPKP